MGQYTAGPVRPGKYTVRVIAKGFTLYQQQEVDISASVSLDVQLSITAEAQVVNVEAEANNVSTDPTQNRGPCRLFALDTQGHPAGTIDLPVACGHAGGTTSGRDGVLYVADTGHLFRIDARRVLAAGRCAAATGASAGRAAVVATAISPIARHCGWHRPYEARWPTTGATRASSSMHPWRPSSTSAVGSRRWALRQR